MIESVVDSVDNLRGKLVVFDNGSVDGSDRMVQDRWGKNRWFSLVRSSENLGFAAAANKAIRDIEADVIILANSDTVFLPGSLETLLESVERYPDAGMLGPRLLWPDGTLQRSLRDFPFPGRLIAEHIPFFSRRSAVNRVHDAEHEVEWFTGAVMVFRKDTFLKIGEFDEDFFFFHEETEMQYRLFLAGHPSVFIPSAEVIHTGGFSAEKMFGRETQLKYIQGKLMFLEKHGYTGSTGLFRLFMGFLLGYRLIAGHLCPGLPRREIRYTVSYIHKAFHELCRRKRRDS